MQEQLFKDLEKLGHKFSNIEKALDMPQNYLSRFKNPENKLPEKWFEPLRDYLNTYTIISSETAIPPRTKLVIEKTGLKEKPSNGIVREVDEVMVKLNKDFGAGTIMYFGDKPNQDYQVISTGSMLLDNALGIGGLPLGRIVEIFGWESSGKTTIALNIIANAQKQGLKCLLVDAENAFDPEYAETYIFPYYNEQQTAILF